jgi:hypothetical protein
VKPSCTVIRFTDDVGLRRVRAFPAYRSAEPANRVANSATPTFSERQKSRM